MRSDGVISAVTARHQPREAFASRGLASVEQIEPQKWSFSSSKSYFVKRELV
jgi:hypothetical protein